MHARRLYIQHNKEHENLHHPDVHFISKRREHMLENVFAYVFLNYYSCLDERECRWPVVWTPPPSMLNAYLLRWTGEAVLFISINILQLYEELFLFFFVWLIASFFEHATCIVFILTTALCCWIWWRIFKAWDSYSLQQVIVLSCFTFARRHFFLNWFVFLYFACFGFMSLALWGALSVLFCLAYRFRGGLLWFFGDSLMFEIHILKDCSIQQMIALVSFTFARGRYCLLFRF